MTIRGQAKKGKGPLFWIPMGCGGITLVGILGIGGCAYLLYSLLKLPADTTHAFFQKINEGDIDGAYAMTTASFQELESPEEFARLASDLKSTDVTLNNRQIENQSATMSGSIMLSGTEYPLTVSLLKIGDDWLIHNFQIEGWTQSRAPAALEVSRPRSRPPPPAARRPAPDTDRAGSTGAPSGAG